MIRVSVFYPQGASFDHDYYVNKHMKMVAEKVGDVLLRFEVDKGLGGAAPGSPAPFVTVCHMYFNSVPEFMQAFAAHAGEIMADVPNYTDGQAEFQISEIIAS